MLHRFGPFELDEKGRSLTLRGEAVRMQPRVFDLLAYLVRNAGRIVPKDELMDALWPDVNVTEASLQRAVSLARTALAEGGLENAIRSFVRHGYRFGLYDPSLGLIAPQDTAADGDIEEARRFATTRDWVAACARFERLAAARAIEGPDLDLWALSVECRGRPAEAVPMLLKAVMAHVEAGEPARAARSAVTLAKIHSERGSGAVASGWLDRAESLLAEQDDHGTRAYLLWMRSRLASSGGRPEEALALIARAHALADQSGDQGLKALTLAYTGFFNMALGRTDEGRAQQNHAAAIALSSRVDPVTGALVYCNILWSCRNFADWSRALQWSEGFEDWCDVSYADSSGDCDLHRAEILCAQRPLAEALARVEVALAKVSDEQSWTIGECYRVRGDIHRMAGDLAAAKADYARASAVGWDAEPGHAMLLLDEGDAEGALAALDRALAGTSWFHLQRRGVLLANAARIAALAGHAGRAAALLAEVEAAAERWPEPPVRAMMLEARAALAPEGDPEAQRLRLLARQVWTGARIEYHAARVRLDLARAFLGAGDEAGAAVEIDAAERSAGRIGARRLAEAAARMRAGPAVRSARPPLAAVRASA